MFVKSTTTHIAGLHDSYYIFIYTLCLKKVPTCKLSITLSCLNRSLYFYFAGKHMKFATKPV